MNRRNVILTTVTSASLLCAMAFAQAVQAPYVNIDPSRHGNLANAQGYIVQAYGRINDAQRDNGDQLGGHAQRAKELLSQANEELRLAADVSNEHRDEQQGPPMQ
jgi:hypothetical protein